MTTQHSDASQRPSALLFDLDGTIVDSDPLHLIAFAEVLAPAGYDVTADFFRDHIHGKKVQDIFLTLVPDQDAAALDLKKEIIFRDHLARSEVEMTAGLVPLLEAAVAQGIPCAIATNGSLENARAVVRKLKITDFFGAVVAAEQVPAGKPAPDVYLEAARLVGADPARALAFEDSVPGITAACAAGCAVFGLTTGLPADALLSAGAVAAIPDFTARQSWLRGWQG